MKLALVALAVVPLLCLGCASSSDTDSAVKPGSGVALNPSGQPPQAQAGLASKMAQTGAAMNSQREKDAAAMAAAKAKAGASGQ